MNDSSLSADFRSVEGVGGVPTPDDFEDEHAQPRLNGGKLEGIAPNDSAGQIGSDPRN